MNEEGGDNAMRRVGRLITVKGTLLHGIGAAAAAGAEEVTIHHPDGTFTRVTIGKVEPAPTHGDHVPGCNSLCGDEASE